MKDKQHDNLIELLTFVKQLQNTNPSSLEEVKKIANEMGIFNQTLIVEGMSIYAVNIVFPN